MYKNKTVIGTAIVALIIGIGIGYVGAGMFKHTTTGTRGGYAAAGGMTGMTRGGGTAGNFLTGTVAAEDSGSITLNTKDGSSHVVLVTPNTTISKSVNGTMSDVTAGSTIIVSGSTNSDGSVSATLIQLRPSTTPAAAPQVQ